MGLVVAKTTLRRARDGSELFPRMVYMNMASAELKEASGAVNYYVISRHLHGHTSAFGWPEKPAGDPR